MSSQSSVPNCGGARSAEEPAWLNAIKEEPAGDCLELLPSGGSRKELRTDCLELVRLRTASGESGNDSLELVRLKGAAVDSPTD